jgi:hypothetical protein
MRFGAGHAARKAPVHAFLAVWVAGAESERAALAAQFRHKDAQLVLRAPLYHPSAR